tara:strand:- start:948 stop:1202 length:255 start_codon:yes stop_codon:yes gene_type:complete
MSYISVRFCAGKVWRDILTTLSCNRDWVDGKDVFTQLDIVATDFLLISKGAVKQLFPSNNNKDMLFKILYFKYKNPIKFIDFII